MNDSEKILKVLGALQANMATVLEEQQAQRTDIRSVQTDINSLAEKVESIRAEMATKADIPHPDKN